MVGQDQAGKQTNKNQSPLLTYIKLISHESVTSK